MLCLFDAVNGSLCPFGAIVGPLLCAVLIERQHRATVVCCAYLMPLLGHCCMLCLFDAVIGSLLHVVPIWFHCWATVVCCAHLMPLLGHCCMLCLFCAVIGPLLCAMLMTCQFLAIVTCLISPLHFSLPMQHLTAHHNGTVCVTVVSFYINSTQSRSSHNL